jgi:hypothetical protein
MCYKFLLILKYHISNYCIVSHTVFSVSYILVMVYCIMSNRLQNEQLSLKENPDSVELVKDSKTDNNKSKSVLKEIIHKAVTFTPASLDPDTKELNEAITCGYEINDYVRTETGIVYILTKWNKQKNSTSITCQQTTDTKNLKEHYEEFLNGEKH